MVEIDISLDLWMAAKAKAELERVPIRVVLERWARKGLASEIGDYDEKDDV